MIDLAEIEARYSRALDAKPGKGPITERGIAAITDSVCDVPDLLAEVKRARHDEAVAINNGGLMLASLEERLDKIHAWAEQIADHIGDQWLHAPACQGEAGCPLCQILEASRP